MISFLATMIKILLIWIMIVFGLTFTMALLFVVILFCGLWRNKNDKQI